MNAPAPASPPLVALVGPVAAALAPRLELSGYGTVALQDGSWPALAPELVVLSPRREDWIPRLRERWGELPLLLGVEEDSVEGRCRCLSSGADDFWLTGLGPSDLLTRLRLHRLRRQQQGAQPETLRVADLAVTPQLRRVQRGQRLLALTAREYQLLLLLLRHRGAIVSRDAILREIWEDQPRAASNVIEVYVRYLRRKLEEGGEARLIHTVRGQGYCLAASPPQPPPQPPPPPPQADPEPWPPAGPGQPAQRR